MNLCLSRAILRDIVDSTKVIHAERKALLIKEYLFKKIYAIKQYS